MKHIVSLFLLLALVWWILSGYPKPLLLGLGLASTLFTLFVAHRLGAVSRETLPLHFAVRLSTYWMNLLWQILVSNLQMVRIVFSAKPDINPRIIRVKVRQTTDFGRAVLGNSITLTPGTVTIDFHGDEVEVHAINEQAASGVEQGYFDQRIPVEESA